MLHDASCEALRNKSSKSPRYAMHADSCYVIRLHTSSCTSTNSSYYQRRRELIMLLSLKAFVRSPLLHFLSSIVIISIIISARFHEALYFPLILGGPDWILLISEIFIIMVSVKTASLSRNRTRFILYYTKVKISELFIKIFGNFANVNSQLSFNNVQFLKTLFKS